MGSYRCIVCWVNPGYGETVDGSEIPRPTTWDICSNLVNSEINYQPQLVIAGFQPSTRLSSRKNWWLMVLGGRNFLGTAGSAKCCSDLYEHFFSRYFCWYYPARFYSHGGFLKWWHPTTMGFPTKNDHFGVFGGYHFFRKHPHRYRKFPPLKGEVHIFQKKDHIWQNSM